MKTILNKFVSNKYRKLTYAQQGEDLILYRIITRILEWDISTKRTYVDIGAYHPIEHSVTYLLYTFGWQGIAIDGRDIQKKFRKYRPNDIFINKIVGKDDNKKTKFYIHKRIGLINQKDTPAKTSEFEEINIPQININKELMRRNIKRIDFLNLDVEGAELEIIKNFDFNNHSPTIIAIEIHGNNVQECLNKEEAKIILNNGYICVGSAVITFFFVKKKCIPQKTTDT